MPWVSPDDGRAKRARLAAGFGAAFVVGALLSPSLSEAAVIKPTFDSTVTSRANAAQIMKAFNSVAASLGAGLASPATINVTVSWGSVDGKALGSGALGSSVDNMYGYFSYSQVKSWLGGAAAANPDNAALVAAAGTLPAALSSGPTRFAISSAEAKALSLIPANQLGADGYVGFSSSAAFDFDPTNGVGSTAYDFQSVAAHELSEVLGRVTGITSSSPTWRSPFDLFRYSAPGALSASYTAPAYFSLDGGITRLGDLNNLGSGDRSDWLSATTGLGDVQTAYTPKGKAGVLSGADVSVLQALGWGSTIAPSGNLLSPTFAARSYLGAAVPEPDAWLLTIAGTGLVGAAARRRRATKLAA